MARADGYIRQMRSAGLSLHDGGVYLVLTRVVYNQAMFFQFQSSRRPCQKLNEETYEPKCIKGLARSSSRYVLMVQGEGMSETRRTVCPNSGVEGVNVERQSVLIQGLSEIRFLEERVAFGLDLQSFLQHRSRTLLKNPAKDQSAQKGGGLAHTFLCSSVTSSALPGLPVPFSLPATELPSIEGSAKNSERGAGPSAPPLSFRFLSVSESIDEMVVWDEVDAPPSDEASDMGSDMFFLRQVGLQMRCEIARERGSLSGANGQTLVPRQVLSQV